MMSRRKLQAERSRVKSPLVYPKEEDEERTPSRDKGGGPDRDTPRRSRAGKKLRKSVRPVGSQLQSQDNCTVPNKSQEEFYSNKRTPKRSSKSNQWTSTFYSPSNDGEQQQEIFWDPYSPAPLKLENGKKKQSANKCTVDISDIVNRIAPKDKPASTDSTMFGIWIEADSIPSTPAIVRARTKVKRSRVKHTEEELMKLAKQFDRNLVETVQHQEQNDQVDGSALSDDKAVNLGDVKNNDFEFLDDIPEDDLELALNSVSQNSVSCPKSSQKSVDQDAEAALNALFDSSTQKCSGRLSPSLSDVSTNSVHEAAISTKADIGLKSLQSKKELLAQPTTSNQDTSQTKLNSVVFQTSGRKTFALSEDKSNNNDPVVSNTVPGISNSHDDFEDEWDTDILEDDSFVMQITQNPDLIATPKHDSPSSKLGLNSSRSAKNCVKVKSTIQDKITPSSSSKLQTFKFVSRKDEKDSKLNDDKTEKVNLSNKSCNPTVNVTVKSIQKPFSSTVSQIPMRPPGNIGGPNAVKPSCSTVGSETKSSFNWNISKNSPDICLQPSRSSSQQKNNIPVKSFIKIAPQKPKQADVPSKGSTQLDEWDDPKFSDEILDMFCESDSLWEANEDDDDLLYQVCDNVERATETQVVNEEKSKEIVQNGSSGSKCSTFTGAGTTSQQSWQSKNGSHIVPLTTVSSANSTRFKGNAVHYNRSSPYSNSTSTLPLTSQSSCQSSSNYNQNDYPSRVHQAPPKYTRSNSVPTGGECSYSKPMLNTSISQNILKPQSSTSNCNNSVAPSKYSFTRIKNSQSVSAHSNHTSTEGQSGLKAIHQKGLGEHRTQRNIPSQHASSKRHFSESQLQSTKVFVAEGKNEKCSLEEIERKKQEALERRKMRSRAFSNYTALT
ncbi:ewing's tumor-associated antigen 1 [Discoglossus pictus]